MSLHMEQNPSMQSGGTQYSINTLVDDQSTLMTKSYDPVILLRIPLLVTAVLSHPQL